MGHIYHKIRGSYPGYIGIEVPEDYQLMLMDEDSFNAYRREEPYQAINLEIKENYCHFQKPVDGSWYVVIEGKVGSFNPSAINIIYKAEANLQSLLTNGSKDNWPMAKTTQPAAFM